MEKRIHEPNKSEFGTDVARWLAASLRYDRHSFSGDGIEDRISRSEEAVGRLLALLNAKGVISDNEMLAVVEAENDGVEIRDESRRARG